MSRPRIFGDILPFIGFRRLDDDDVREIGLDPCPGYYWQSIEVEWFGFGVVIDARMVKA